MRSSFFVLRINVLSSPSSFQRKSSGICEKCPLNTFSIKEINNGSCTSCSNYEGKGLCSDGFLYFSEDYWRSSRKNLFIMKYRSENGCLKEENPRSISDFDFDENPGRNCVSGYIGAACGDCDREGRFGNKTTVIISQSQCGICEKNW